ncbi:MAG: hypothetical protein RL216_1521 [Pseudomonadota bacterium]|jgi:hypothetical protein
MIIAKKTLGAVALVLAGALPVAAEVTTMTCGEFTALDSVAKKETADEMLKWLKNSSNAMEVPNLVAKYASQSGSDDWDPEKFVLEIEGHCQDAGASVAVFDRLQEHS